MNDSTLERLARAQAVRQERIRPARLQEAQKQAAQARFSAAFPPVRDQVIRPVVEEFHEYLSASGHTSQILIQDDPPPHHGVTDWYESALIALVVFPADSDAEQATRWRQERQRDMSFLPQVRFGAIAPQMRVGVYVSDMVPGCSGGQGGVVRSYRLDELTADLVERELVVGLERIFAQIPAPDYGRATQEQRAGPPRPW
jgi:hypothetical protein